MTARLKTLDHRIAVGTFVSQQPAAHHRRQCGRTDRRRQTAMVSVELRIRETCGDQAGHEQQWNEPRSSAHLSEIHRESDIAGAFERASRGFCPSSMCRHDVFNHDDGIVDHETRADRSCISERLSAKSSRTT